MLVVFVVLVLVLVLAVLSWCVPSLSLRTLP